MKLLAPGIMAIDSPFLSKDNTGLGNVLFQLAGRLLYMPLITNINVHRYKERNEAFTDDHRIKC
jgi:hypothetical protein